MASHRTGDRGILGEDTDIAIQATIIRWTESGKTGRKTANRDEITGVLLREKRKMALGT